MTMFPLAEMMGILDILSSIKNFLMVFLGFSIIIFVHELGHFLAAKMCDIRVDRFAVGFGRSICTYRTGIGFRWGSAQAQYRQHLDKHIAKTRADEGKADLDSDPTAEENRRASAELGYGETEYAFNVLPLGGYVKMLGQEDFEIDKAGEMKLKTDPRAFSGKTVGQRMFVVSAGVIMNLIFAALLFMVVFMIGLAGPAPIIGAVQRDSPAEHVGLRPGDKIIEINGEKIREFYEVMPAIMLAEPNANISITFERDQGEGKPPLVKKVFIQPEMNTADNRLQIGIGPSMGNVAMLSVDDPELPEEEQVKFGDKILTIAGQEMSSLYGIQSAIREHKGEWVPLKIERPVGTEGETKIIETKRRAYLHFQPTGDPMKEAGHLCGFVPRRAIKTLTEQYPAEKAGLKPGDILVKWDGLEAPTYLDIINSVRGSGGKEIEVVVLRPKPDGTHERIEKTVTPRRPGIISAADYLVGMDPMRQDNDHLVVSQIITEVTEGVPTPAAAVKDMMPIGSLITHVNGEPVKAWNELFARFKALAGTDVELTWEYEGAPVQSGKIYIPHTLGTTFDLPTTDVITEIDGQQSISVFDNGEKKVYSLPNSWIAITELLREHLGQTIKIKHQPKLAFTDQSDADAQVREITVTEEMLDTWVTRVDYEADILVTQPIETKVREPNPVLALAYGVKKTWYFIKQVYTMVNRMIVSKSVGLDQVSGPVGIIKTGAELANHDMVKLLFFMAMISANLAVINFMPIPIVDGGLFVCLIIEKLKGSPLSLRFQMIANVIGLALIASVFIYVTIQDIMKI